MAALIDRRAFSDFRGLEALGAGRLPSAEETLRRVFVIERRTDVGRPDHFYKGYLQDRLGEVRHVAGIPALVLGRLAERYVERRGGRLQVRSERFVEWHELLPYISPLAVVVAFLVAERGDAGPVTDPRPALAAELGDTALLGPLDYALDDLVERKGLHELHMHLNGSTELDVLWPIACTGPDAYYRELRAAAAKNAAAVAELYEQIEPGLDPMTVYRRLRAARRVRRRLADVVAADLGLRPPPAAPDPVLGDGLASLSDLMRSGRSDLFFDSPSGPGWSTHPARVIFAGPTHKLLVEEAAFLHACLTALRRRPDDPVIGTGLYFNLLVQSQVARLSVQQVEETGFDQFQKYTFTGTREGMERSYLARFQQLNGRPPYDALAHLEARFAPKDSADGTRALIARVVQDYLRFRGCGCARVSPDLRGPVPACLLDDAAKRASPPNGRRGAELSLVAHFIKRPPDLAKDVALRCHDSQLRIASRRQARGLARLLADSAVAGVLLRGVDAAANELHASPEPFAPAFRIARRAGISRATFHVGEDFRHLLSGIRAIAEARTFLDLGTGDRLGHATAIGILPSLWLSRTAPRCLLPRLAALDDAVHAHRVLAARGGFEREVFKLEGLIATHSAATYGEEQSPALLQRAWELRSLDPLLVRVAEASLARSGCDVDARGVAAEAGALARRSVDSATSAELDLIARRVGDAGAAFDLFLRRHALGSAARTATVEVDADVVGVDALEAMQEEALAELNRHGVAIETLPTSNLRISYYDALAEHHVFRWLGLTSPTLANKPTVVVGSDDPGIFATSLRNEYAALSNVLRGAFGMTERQAAQTLEALGDAARTRRFRPPSVVPALEGRPSRVVHCPTCSTGPG